MCGIYNFKANYRLEPHFLMKGVMFFVDTIIKRIGRLWQQPTNALYFLRHAMHTESLYL